MRATFYSFHSSFIIELAYHLLLFFLHIFIYLLLNVVYVRIMQEAFKDRILKKKL